MLTLKNEHKTQTGVDEQYDKKINRRFKNNFSLIGNKRRVYSDF